jgi:surface carbohydrate biosynthesis protein
VTVPLIIPAENQVREFDAKLLLGCVAAERGHQAIVGSRTEMHWHIASLPRGIYIAKDFRGSSRRMFRILQDLGNDIVAWDEEGLVHASDDRYYKHRIAPDLYDQVRLFLAWGSNNARTLKAYPGYKGAPIEITGNPRVDMMRPELRAFFAAEVDALCARYGRGFILLNTNFGRINHIQPTLMQAGGPAAPKDDYWRASNAYFRGIFDRMRGLVPRLAAAFADRSIVVRPHPSEAHGPWAEAGAGHANVHVVSEGSVLPWLIAASVMVHNGCTTGIEAAALDRPVITFRPQRDDRYDFPLPNNLSAEASSEDAVIEKVAEVLRGGTLSYDACRQDLVESTFAALRDRLASDRIVDVVANHAAMRPHPMPGMRRRLAGWAAAELRGMRKRLINQHIAGHKNDKAYQRTRFPGVSVDEVRRRVSLFKGCLGRFHGVRVHQLAPNVFELTA